MTVPKTPDKHRHRAILEPSDMVAFERSRGRVPNEDPPSAAIIGFQARLFDHVASKHQLRAVDGYQCKMHLIDGDRPVGVAQLDIGAPAAAAQLEALIALGIGTFICIGTAGSLQSHLQMGDLIVCEKALRDEGTSHHYLEPARYAHPARKLTARVQESLDALDRRYITAPSWTVDAVFRETEDEVRRYAAEGVAVVEMEAAALFAVAEYRGAEIAAMFSVSDSVASGTWVSGFGSEAPARGLVRLFYAAQHALIGQTPTVVSRPSS